MNVSPNFSPSIKLMKPYFIFSSFFYLLSMFVLLFINPNSTLKDLEIIAWVHLYMIGFIMMAIFSAMAQLGPIIVETAHHTVKVFKYIWIFLILGLALILYGFYINLQYLTYGGLLVLVAMSTYAIEFLLTLKNAKRKTAITKAMIMSNIFLLLGIISGIIMALGFNGIVEIDPNTLLSAHIFGLIVGFVILLIMGISIVLIPMFGFCKRISDNQFRYSFYTLSLGVITMIISPIFLSVYLQNIAYLLTVAAIILYLYQLFKMTSSRARTVHDIWAKSMYVGFISFIISFALLCSYLINENETVLKLGMWLMFVGFFGFLIIGNYYKIVPFLVWFQIYSPLIEEKSVPMLHELVPNRLVNLQWFYSTVGLIVSSVGLALKNENIFYAGITFLIMGGVIFFVVINKIINKNL